jgi:hypothetical protein
VSRIGLFVKLRDPVDREAFESGGPLEVQLTAPDTAPAEEVSIAAGAGPGDLPFGALDYATPVELGTWTLEVREDDIAQLPASLRETVTVDATTHQRLRSDAIEDIGIVVYHRAEA